MIVNELTGKARTAVNQDAAIVALDGSVRSGKTICSLIEWLDFCRHGPEGQLAITGRTAHTIAANVIYPLQEMLGHDRVRFREGASHVSICGRPVAVVGANTEDSVTRIQGRTLAGAYVDEAASIPESFFNMLHSRLSADGARMWLTTNPEGPNHWLKLDWLDRARIWTKLDGSVQVKDTGLDLARVSFRLEDNPNLAQAYIDRLKSAHTGLWYRRYIMGEWCIAAGAIYEDWDPALHVLAEDKLPTISRLLAVGLDYGTNNPTRGVLLGLSAEATPRLVVIDEWTPERGTDAALSKSLREWLGRRTPEWVMIDPSAASLKLQLNEDQVLTMDATNAVLPGVRLIASLLATGSLVISDRCSKLIGEFPDYSWDEKAAAKGEDKPIKVNDHSLDALRYAVASTRSIWGVYVSTTMALDQAA